MNGVVEELGEKINSILKDNKNLGAYALKARVNQDGIVQIQGIVDVLDEKFQAEALVRKIPGVMGIENDITVCTDGPVDDEDVAFEVSEELRANPDIPETVGVKVYAGEAQLVGTINNRSEMDEAIESARKARGVREVNSQLKFVEEFDDPSVTNLVQDALMEKLDLVPGQVQVNTEDGVVTLSGNLSKEKAMKVEQIVSEVSGVKRIVNEIISEKAYVTTAVEKID